MGTEWDSGHGGLSTFNRELCIAVAALGHEVCCALPTATADVRARAAKSRVKIATPKPVVGMSPEFSFLQRPLADCPKPDVIVGHARITGTFAAVQQQDHYPAALRVQIFHMNPRSIEGFKQTVGAVQRASTRIKDELALASGAGLLLAVGPTLHRAYATYLNAHPVPVHEILPGIAAMKRSHRAPPQFTALLCGRMEDSRLKGVDVAVEAMKAVLRDDRKAAFHILGADREHSDEQWQKLIDEFDDHGNRVSLDNFTDDAEVVTNAIRCASVVLMPSRSEGYGLIGLEALAEGVPIVISESSGLAETLRTLAPDDCEAFIVPANDATALTQAIADVRRSPVDAIDRAKRLHLRLSEKLQWHLTAQRLVDLVMPLASPDGTPPAGLTLGSSTQPSDLHAPVPVTTPSPREAMERLLHTASLDLLNWPSTLASGLFIDRPERTRVARLIEGDTKLVLLLGPPGSGKSALLARLAQGFSAQAHFVLAIKADQLPGTVQDDLGLGHALGFPFGALETIQAASNLGGVIVFIDQLDALADLVDYRTGRLDALLYLIDALKDLENVRVVASSRAFEASQDLRLAELDAERITLEPISAATVREVVSLSVHISPQVVELLRHPLWLSLFQQLDKANAVVAMPSSEYALLEMLWRHFAARESRVPTKNLLLKLADLIEAREELWIPIGDLSVSDTELQVATGEGLLRLTSDSTRVSFAHQRIFEFALAMRFASGGIAEYALQNQDGLAARRTIWATLQLCRTANARVYREEFEKLTAEAMRLHLRVLVAQFLATTASVHSFELHWILDQVSDDAVRRRFFDAMAGNQAWFSKLENEYLPAWMNERFAHELFGVLTKGWSIDAVRVLELVREQWMAKPEYRVLAANVLASCTAWTSDAIEASESLLAFDLGYAGEHLIRSMSASAPDAAAKAFVAMSGRRLQHAIDALLAKNHRLIADVVSDALEELQIFEAGEHAAKSPEIFLRQFCDVLCRSVSQHGADRARFFGETRGLERSPYEVIQALEVAFESLSSNNTLFLELVSKYGLLELDAVQSMLMRVLARAAERHTQAAIEFLALDTRRMLMEHEAHALVLEIGKFASGEQIAKLHRLISTVDKYDVARHEDPSARRELRRANQEYRSWLIEALSRTSASDAAKHLRRTVDGSAEIYRPSREVFSHGLQSPMLSAHMAKARDGHIIGFLEGVPDSANRRHPKSFDVGGSIEASREFAAFASDHPRRAIAIISTLRPGHNERPAAYALESVAKLEGFSDEVESLVAALDERGFISSAFREVSARSLNSIAERGGLSSRSLALLEKWLSESFEESESPQKSGQPEERRTILWHERGGSILPGGAWPFLEAIVSSLLFSPQKNFEHLERILLRHSTRAENPAVWRAVLMMYSRNFAYWGATSSAKLIDALFDFHREVMESEDGIATLAFARWWAPSEKFRQWLNLLRVGNWKYRDLAVGELLGLAGLHANGIPWAVDEVNALVRREAQANVDILHGIANSGARLWGNPVYRAASTDAVCSILQTRESILASAALRAVHHGEMRPDSYTARLLRALLEAKPELKEPIDFDFVSQLVPLVSWNPKLVCEAVGYAMEKSDPQRLRTDWFGADIVRIALTAHRIQRTREDGLALFERTLGLGVRFADDAIGTLDGVNMLGSASYSVRHRRFRKRFAN